MVVQSYEVLEELLHVCVFDKQNNQPQPIFFFKRKSLN
jgi:hypothetical protein